MVTCKDMLDLIKARQSDRSYTGKEVEKEKIDRVMEAARLAPSACNAQPWKFIVVNDPQKLKQLSEAASAKLIGMNIFVAEAPLLIVVIREKPNFSSRIGGKIKKRDYSLIDIGIVSAHICLQAEAEGLGSCMIGWFDEKMVKKILDVPASKRVELLITIGYPGKPKREKKRKRAEEVVSLNHY